MKYGFSAIDDVTKKDGGRFRNEQESFLFAEVFKYSYLVFAAGEYPIRVRHAIFLRS